jgi:hypothetical protein
MAAPKKPWTKPVIRKLDLSADEIAKLFPELKPNKEDQAGKDSDRAAA